MPFSMDSEHSYREVNRLLFGELDSEEKSLVEQEQREIAEYAKRLVQPGDVIQISPDAHPGFSGLLALVEDVKKWGVTAFVQSTGAQDGRYYVRLEWSLFEYIGRAAFLPEDILSGRG
jgi:hypothetical protein